MATTLEGALMSG